MRSRTFAASSCDRGWRCSSSVNSSMTHGWESSSATISSVDRVSGAIWAMLMALTYPCRWRGVSLGQHEREAVLVQLPGGVEHGGEHLVDVGVAVRVAGEEHRQAQGVDAALAQHQRQQEQPDRVDRRGALAVVAVGLAGHEAEGADEV